MKIISALLEKMNTLTQLLGLRKAPEVSPPTEYQHHVAHKATELLSLIQQSELKNRFITMQDFLKEIIACKVTLPSQSLSGWTWYFVFENSERLDLKYPKICAAVLHLSYLMDFDSMEKFDASRRLLKSINN